MHEHKEHHGLLFGALASLSISIASIFVKLCESVPSETLTFFRFFIGFILFLPWLLKHKISFSFKHLPMHLVRDLAGLGAVFCYFYSIKYIPLINATTLRNTSPLFISLIILVWWRLSIPKWRILAIIIGFIGVVTMLRPTTGFHEFPSIVGLFGGFCSALGLVAVQRMSSYVSTYSILFTYFLLSAIIMLFPMLATWQPIQSPIIWLFILLIGIFETLFQYLLTLSFTHAHASKAGLTIYLMVIFNGLFGWIIWKETPDLWDWAGVALIVLGGVIAMLDKQKPTPMKWRR